MFDLTPIPHFCTNNCKSPIRAKKPDAIHPYLHDVSGNRPESTPVVSAKPSISYNSDRLSESDTTPTPPLPNTSSESNTASESAPTPAAGGASGGVR